jgi:hypothetical protein
MQGRPCSDAYADCLQRRSIDRVQTLLYVGAMKLSGLVLCVGLLAGVACGGGATSPTSDPGGAGANTGGTPGAVSGASGTDPGGAAPAGGTSMTGGAGATSGVTSGGGGGSGNASGTGGAAGASLGGSAGSVGQHWTCGITATSCFCDTALAGDPYPPGACGAAWTCCIEYSDPSGQICGCNTESEATCNQDIASVSAYNPSRVATCP